MITKSIMALGRPVAYYPVLAKFFGGDIACAVFVCQFIYWFGRVGNRQIYKSREEIETETGIGAESQKRICRKLKGLGYLKIEKKGMPARNFYLFDWDLIDSDFVEFSTTSAVESPSTVRSNHSHQCGRITPTSEVESPPLRHRLPETTTETTYIEGSPPERESPPRKGKHRYGEFRHVLLTDEEYEKLPEKVDDREKWIRELDEGIELKGYQYASHYLAILKWYGKSLEKSAQAKGKYDPAIELLMR